MAKPLFVVSYLDSSGTPKRVVYDNQVMALKASQYLIDKGAKDVRVRIKFGLFEQASRISDSAADTEVA